MAKPFLKWAGGKGQLLNVINEHLPAHFTTYIEPFVGSGAVMFNILNSRRNVEHVVINDINTDLINTYTSIREHYKEMVVILSDLQREYICLDSEGRAAMFYAIREEYNNRDADNIRQASLFIFLNRTCFNGLYRVNSNNRFNVPHGKYKAPKICDAENLANVAEQLRVVDIRNDDFNNLRNTIVEGAFVYLDPPYKPISETSSFNSYSAVSFDDTEQIRLRDFCNYINDQGAFFMLSNSDPASVNAENRFFDEIYARYNIRRVLAKRNINANGNNRGEINELLITNF